METLFGQIGMRDAKFETVDIQARLSAFLENNNTHKREKIMAIFYRTIMDRPYYGLYTGPYYGATTRTEEQIEADVIENLAWDNWVDSTKVNVDVTGSVVTLTGTTDRFVEKRSAGDDAADVLGVTDVINNITVTV